MPIEKTNLSMRLNVFETTNGVDRGDEKLYTIHRGVENDDDKTGEKYDGVYYRNTFKVYGGSIYLKKVGFFGPKKAARDVYSADVELHQAVWERNTDDPPCWKQVWDCLTMAELVSEYKTLRGKARKYDHLVKKGEVWWVAFPEAIRIEEDTWMEIHFKIEGTEPMARMKFGTQSTTKRVETERGPRVFDFMLGSCQMPGLEFCVREDVQEDFRVEF